MTFKKIEHYNIHLSFFSEKNAYFAKQDACGKVTI